jgi:hypothetical protein
VGTAATTVDLYTVLNVNQTTANQTLTLPNPTDTTTGRMLYVNNVGSVEFMMYGSHVDPGDGRQFIWNGSSWTKIFWSEGSGTQTKTASTTQTVTNSTTLVNHTDLSFNIGANETIVFQYTLLVSNNNSATPDFKAAIFGPAGVTCNVTMSGEEPAGTAYPQANSTNCTTPNTLVNNTIVASTIPYNVYINGYVTAGATAGTVNLQFAENTAGAGTSVSILPGSYMQAFQTSGADVAEIYYSKDFSITEGDVVMVDSTKISQIVKADRTKSLSTLGVVSTKPGLVLGNVDAVGKPVIVGLAGRVPVKVTNSGGNISVGDYLTSSNYPGYAMKATGPGQVIGQALTSFSSESANATGTVVVFINNTYHDGLDIVQSTTTATSTTLSDGSIAERFTHYVRTALENLTNVFLDMTLWVSNLNTDRIQTKELCIEDVCINKYKLQDIIRSTQSIHPQNVNPTPESSASSSQSSTTSATTTIMIPAQTSQEFPMSEGSTTNPSVLDLTTEVPISNASETSVFENGTADSENETPIPVQSAEDRAEDQVLPPVQVGQ